MGMTVYSATYIGFQVEEHDLWAKIPAAQETCEQGHPKKGTALFCEEDGTKFQKRPTREPTAAFRALIRFLEWNEGQGAASDWERLYARLREDYLANVNCFTSSEDRRHNLAVAIKLREARDDDTRPHGISLTVLASRVEHLEKIRGLMGLKTEIQIFPSCYISY